MDIQREASNLIEKIGTKQAAIEFVSRTTLYLENEDLRQAVLDELNATPEEMA